MTPYPIIFIVGPTAVGKSEAALALAKMLDGEIVSCDAMQVYRELDILTNKPSKDILKKFPHHLINIVSVKENFDVFQFHKKANEAIDRIRAKKRAAIVVGGSGLYMRILLEGIFEGKEQDPSLREKLVLEAKKIGNVKLHDRLKKVDPDAAKNIHPNNVKRVIRALEIYETEGRPFAEVKDKRNGLWGNAPVVCFALNRPREELYATINARVDDMFAQGAVEEVRALKGIHLSETAQGIIGVKEIQDFLEGKIDEERTKDLIRSNTRHLAKRQWTWFNKEKRLHWIMLKNGVTPHDAAREIKKTAEEHKYV